MWLKTSLVFRKGESYRLIDNKSGIYRLYDAEGSLLYVGKSGKLRSRIKQHIDGSTHTRYFSDEIKTVLIAYIEASSKELEQIETYYIQTMAPIYNEKTTKISVKRPKQVAYKKKRSSGILNTASRMFIRGLEELINENSVTIVPVKRSQYESGQNIVGYYDNSYFYLEKKTSINEVMNFYQNQGVRFPVTPDMLLKHLENDGLIEVRPNPNGKSTNRTLVKKIGGKTRRLVFLKRESMVISLKEVTS